MLKQTYQNYHIFLIGDDYEDEEEFNQIVSLFPSEKIYSYNNKFSYRENYFSLNGLLFPILRQFPLCSANEDPKDKAAKNTIWYLFL